MKTRVLVQVCFEVDEEKSLDILKSLFNPKKKIKGLEKMNILKIVRIDEEKLK